MNKLHDPELELFKRSVDLVDYAKKAGYEPRPHDGAPGLTVLDHPNRDCIVVGKSPTSPWIYASVPDYVPRAPGEPSEQALSRLRHAIDRTGDKGSIVEFVQRRDPLARSVEVTLDQVRYRLRSFRAHGLPLDFEGALTPPPYGRSRERSADHGREPPAPGDGRRPAGPGIPNPELNRRRYDWDPPPAGAPRETEVEQRLRRWREAQTAVEVKVQRTAVTQTPPAMAAPRAPAPAKSAPERTARAAESPKSELNRRRYDWTPAPPGLEALLKAARNRSPDRGR
jgi:hypothetical protein